MKITHYAARNLHDYDQMERGFDVVAKADDGTIYYSEDIFNTIDEATAFIDKERENLKDFSYWEDNPLHTAKLNPDAYDWRAA